MNGTGRLSGLVAVVTGGSGGIGRAVVDRYVAEGARVVVLDRDAETAAALAEQHPHAVGVVLGDVRDAEAQDEVVGRAMSEFGRLDTYVGNAGVYDFGLPLEQMTAKELSGAFREIFEINVLGPLQGVRAAAAELRRTRGSVILTVSSSGAYAGGGGSLYVGSKHAVAGLVKQLANELAPDVRVNGVAPGATHTGLAGLRQFDDHERRLQDETALLAGIARALPVGFVSEPEDHAGLYVTLADARDSRFLTGVVIASDGGLAAGPRSRARNA